MAAMNNVLLAGYLAAAMSIPVYSFAGTPSPKITASVWLQSPTLRAEEDQDGLLLNALPIRPMGGDARALYTALGRTAWVSVRCRFTGSGAIVDCQGDRANQCDPVNAATKPPCGHNLVKGERALAELASQFRLTPKEFAGFDPQRDYLNVEVSLDDGTQPISGWTINVPGPAPTK